MANLKKIFKPDIMFNDHIKSCWSDNIKLNDAKKVMLHKELKLNGVYALNIEPMQDKNYFVLCLPVNKNWGPEDLTRWKDPVLCFEATSSEKLKMTVQLSSDKNESIQKQDVYISEDEGWAKVELPLVKTPGVRSISFSGSSAVSNIIMKDIVIRDR